MACNASLPPGCLDTGKRAGTSYSSDIRVPAGCPAVFPSGSSDAPAAGTAAGTTGFRTEAQAEEGEAEAEAQSKPGFQGSCGAWRGMVVDGASGQILVAPAAVAASLGYTADELSELTVFDLADNLKAHEWRSAVGRLAAGEAGEATIRFRLLKSERRGALVGTLVDLRLTPAPISAQSMQSAGERVSLAEKRPSPGTQFLADLAAAPLASGDSPQPPLMTSTSTSSSSLRSSTTRVESGVPFSPSYHRGTPSPGTRRAFPSLPQSPGARRGGAAHGAWSAPLPSPPDSAHSSSLPGSARKAPLLPRLSLAHNAADDDEDAAACGLSWGEDVDLMDDDSSDDEVGYNHAESASRAIPRCGSSSSNSSSTRLTPRVPILRSLPGLMSPASVPSPRTSFWGGSNGPTTPGAAVSTGGTMATAGAVLPLGRPPIPPPRSSSVKDKKDGGVPTTPAPTDRSMGSRWQSLSPASPAGRESLSLKEECGLDREDGEARESQEGRTGSSSRGRHRKDLSMELVFEEEVAVLEERWVKRPHSAGSTNATGASSSIAGTPAGYGSSSSSTSNGNSYGLAGRKEGKRPQPLALRNSWDDEDEWEDDEDMEMNGGRTDPLYTELLDGGHRGALSAREPKEQQGGGSSWKRTFGLPFSTRSGTASATAGGGGGGGGGEISGGSGGTAGGVGGGGGSFGAGNVQVGSAGAGYSGFVERSRSEPLQPALPGRDLQAARGAGFSGAGEKGLGKPQKVVEGGGRFVHIPEPALSASESTTSAGSRSGTGGNEDGEGSESGDEWGAATSRLNSAPRIGGRRASMSTVSPSTSTGAGKLSLSSISPVPAPGPPPTSVHPPLVPITPTSSASHYDSPRWRSLAMLSPRVIFSTGAAKALRREANNLNSPRNSSSSGMTQAGRPSSADASLPTALPAPSPRTSAALARHFKIPGWGKSGGGEGGGGGTGNVSGRELPSPRRFLFRNASEKGPRQSHLAHSSTGSTGGRPAEGSGGNNDRRSTKASARLPSPSTSAVSTSFSSGISKSNVGRSSSTTSSGVHNHHQLQQQEHRKVLRLAQPQHAVDGGSRAPTANHSNSGTPRSKSRGGFFRAISSTFSRSLDRARFPPPSPRVRGVSVARETPGLAGSQAGVVGEGMGELSQFDRSVSLDHNWGKRQGQQQGAEGLPSLQPGGRMSPLPSFGNMNQTTRGRERIPTCKSDVQEGSVCRSSPSSSGKSYARVPAVPVPESCGSEGVSRVGSGELGSESFGEKTEAVRVAGSGLTPAGGWGTWAEEERSDMDWFW